MSYRVELTRSAENDLDSLPQMVQDRIWRRILALGDNPWPPGTVKIGAHRYRLRAGDYRAIYDVDDRAQRVLIRRAGHRKDIYR